ncbi:MAG: hypothetical protein AAGF04_00680 [Chlamydiota bacterium]
MKKEGQWEYRQFAQHVHNLRISLENYRKYHKHPEHVLAAYRQICKDALGKSRLKRDLAKAIVETFQNFPLRLGPKGRPHSAHSFLLDYELGKIRSEKDLAKGMDGVCSNLGLTIMRMYDPDSISAEIEETLSE